MPLLLTDKEIKKVYQEHGHPFFRTRNVSPRDRAMAKAQLQKVEKDGLPCELNRQGHVTFCIRESATHLLVERPSLKEVSNVTD